MHISYSTKTRLEKTEIYLLDYLDYRVNYSVLVILFWQIWLISSYISLSLIFVLSVLRLFPEWPFYLILVANHLKKLNYIQLFIYSFRD